MAHSRQRESWNQTAHVLAMLLNVNRDPKSPVVSPLELMPAAFAPKRKVRKVAEKMPIRLLRDVFFPGHSAKPDGKLIGGGDAPMPTPST